MTKFSFFVRILVDTDCFFRIKEDLRKKFAKLANDFEQKLHSISSELASISGPLEVRFHLKLIFYRYLLKTITGSTATHPAHPDTPACTLRRSIDSQRCRIRVRCRKRGGERLHRVHMPRSRIRAGVGGTCSREEDRVYR